MIFKIKIILNCPEKFFSGRNNFFNVILTDINVR